MSAVINSKRFRGPDRPMSADPSATSSRPSFSTFSSFSSSITSSLSSAFGGRHSRSNSTSTQNAANPPRPASTAPQAPAKWQPGSGSSPLAANQSRSSRHRSTSSASAAAAAALSSSVEASVPPLPQDSRPSGPVPPGEGTENWADTWRMSVQRSVNLRNRRRVQVAEQEFRDRMRALHAGPTPSSRRRRDSISSGSSGSVASSVSEGRLSEEMRLRAAHEQTLARLKKEYEEEVRAVIVHEAQHGIPPPPLASSRSQRDRERETIVLVEDETVDEWTWRPDELPKEKMKELVRQEQQVIWDAIKRSGTPAVQQQQQPPLSSSAGRKVHFASASVQSSDSSSNPPSATPIASSQTQPPSLPRTPHTPVGAGFPAHLSARSMSAHPSVSAATSSANRPLSPAVTAAGVRPGSARPASPAYMRWIPPSAPTASSTPSSGQNLGAKSASNPIAIPGRTGGTGHGDGNGSAGKATGGSGSWREWSVSGGHTIRRDASTPSPTATNGSSFGHGHGYARTASNSNLHPSGYTPVQMHGRTPSSGNLTSHGRIPSSGNLQSNSNVGAGMRRAMTPAVVSSASEYARQRTASVTQRAPSVPPVLPSATTREREREYAYGREYTSLREKEKERERANERRAKAGAGVVDDREPEDAVHHSQPRMKQVQATAGLGSRQSSARSALVDEDAPPPETFSSKPIPIRSSTSRHSTRAVDPAAEEEEEIPAPPKRDKGKGKARAPPSPVLSSVPLPGAGKRLRKGSMGMGPATLYAAQLEDFARELRRDLGISAEA